MNGATENKGCGGGFYRLYSTHGFDIDTGLVELDAMSTYLKFR